MSYLATVWGSIIATLNPYEPRRARNPKRFPQDAHTPPPYQAPEKKSKRHKRRQRAKSRNN